LDPEIWKLFVYWEGSESEPLNVPLFMLTVIAPTVVPAGAVPEAAVSAVFESEIPVICGVTGTGD
jgi:hypothetical protein